VRPNNDDYARIRQKRIDAILNSKPYSERREMTASALGHMIGLEPEEIRSVLLEMVLNRQLIKTVRGMRAFYTPPAPSIISQDWRHDHSVHAEVERLMRGW
jgi:hypothetical protein